MDGILIDLNVIELKKLINFSELFYNFLISILFDDFNTNKLKNHGNVIVNDLNVIDLWILIFFYNLAIFCKFLLN